MSGYVLLVVGKQMGKVPAHTFNASAKDGDFFTMVAEFNTLEAGEIALQRLKEQCDKVFAEDDVTLACVLAMKG